MKQALKRPNELLGKALRLIREGQVSRINSTQYKVKDKSAPPTYPPGYNVEKLESGMWVCSCPGFHKRSIAFCSHILAVMTLESKDRAGS